jgi:hypothetical protein
MSKCLNCDNEAIGRSKYCSDSCKVLFNRKQKTVNNDTVNTTEQAAVNIPYTIIDGQEVYHRQAVKYPNDDFETRPMPLEPHDRPVPMNRGIYERGNIRYIIDCTGKPLQQVDGEWFKAKPMPKDDAGRWAVLGLGPR